MDQGMHGSSVVWIEGCMDPGFCVAKGLHEQGFAWFSCGKSPLTAFQDNMKQK